MSSEAESLGKDSIRNVDVELARQTQPDHLSGQVRAWLSGSTFAISVFCALLLASFASFMLRGKVLAPLDIVSGFYEPWTSTGVEQSEISVHNHFVTDAVDQYLNYRWIASVSLKQDGYVGWSPLTFGGRPEYANTMATNFDWSMQLHRVFSFWDAWDIGLLLQLAIAGIGMFVFLRGRELHPPVCLAGAIAYAGNSQFVVWMYHRWALGSFCWVPWILWSLGRINNGNRPVRAVSFAVFTALAMLGGNLQYDAFILLTIACFLGGSYLQDKPCCKVALERVALVLASLGFTAVLTTMMFVPCIQGFFDTAAMGNDRAVLQFQGGWLQPLLHPAVSILSAFPVVLGSPSSLDLTKPLKGDYFDIAFFGFLPVVVAFYSLIQRRTPKPAWLLMFCGLVLPLTPLQGYVYYRISLLFIVGGIWAFAEFWESLDAEAARLFANRALLIFFCFSAIWGSISIVVSLNQVAIAAWFQARIASQLSLAHLGMYRAWMLGRVQLWTHEFPIWSGKSLAAWVLAFISLLLVRLRRTLPDTWVTHLLSVVLTVQVLTFAVGWLTVSPRPSTGILPATDQMLKLKQIVGNGRVYVATDKGGRPFFPPNTLAAFDVASLDGYESIWFPSMWHKEGYSTDGISLSQLGVRFAVVQRNGHNTARACWDPDTSADAPSVPEGVSGSCWPLIYSGSQFDVYQNNQAVAHYTGMNGSFEISVLEPIMETFNRRILRVPPGIDAVRVTENWSREWRYRTDKGEWHPAKQSEDMAILLPIGHSDMERTVELQFWPFEWATLISYAGWLIAGTILLMAAGRHSVDRLHSESAVQQ